MKTALATLSVVNGLVGLGLLVMYAAAGDVPVVVAALGVGMLIQGGFTLGYLAGMLHGLEPWSQRALIAGQTVALLVGALGFMSSAIYNLNPPEGDPEYGPLTVGALIAFQAAVTLWIFAVRGRSRWPGASAT